MLSELIYNKVAKCKFIYDEKNIEFPNHINEEIKNNWNELMNLGKEYTNGEIFTVASIQFNRSNCLEFRMLKTNFAHYLYTVKQKFEGDYICRSIATSALFITKDNYYVLGKMASKTSLAGKIKFVGGAISRDDFIGNEIQPIKCIKREVAEEIGLNLDDESKVKSVKLNYFITRKNFSCFKVNLNLSSDEILTMFNGYNEYLSKNNLEQELESLVLVKNNTNDVNKFLIDNKDNVIEYLEELLLVDIEVNEARNFSDDIKNGKILEWLS